ncbi:MAG TPA: hypothetical protein VMF69_24920 [Gemmataceae bacterium]|nr:hypothetical protein [Gemmataceae bacterium]
MGKLINHDKAMKYLDGLADPIVQSLIQYAYGKIIMEDLIDNLESDFDLLFFFKTLEALLRDREQLAKALLGEIQDTFARD